jgi:hypothetical protein
MNFSEFPGRLNRRCGRALRHCPRDLQFVAEPTIRSRQRAVGPFLSRARQLSIDILFHARYEAIVSRAITRVWAENREKSWGSRVAQGGLPPRAPTEPDVPN